MQKFWCKKIGVNKKNVEKNIPFDLACQPNSFVSSGTKISYTCGILVSNVAHLLSNSSKN